MKTIMGLFFSFMTFSVFASVDLSKSIVKWKGTKKFGDPHMGTIAFKAGKLMMEGNMIKSGEFEIDMTKINNTDLSGEWKTKLEAHLKNAEFFDVEKHGTSKFVIKNADANKVTGDLTIKNITKSVTIPFKKEGDKLVGTFTFDRTVYDVRYNSTKFFPDLEKTAKDKIIDDQVEVKFELALTK
jgi:hypothetical protein